MHKIRVVIYSKAHCYYSVRAMQLLAKINIGYEEIMIEDLTSDLFVEMLRKSKGKTFPQIFVDDKAIGGYDNLVQLVDQGKLDGLQGE